VRRAPSGGPRSGDRLAKPVLFATGHAPHDRIGAFRRLHERESVEFALFGGRTAHGGMTAAWQAEPATPDGGPLAPDPGELPFPHRRVHAAGLAALAASGRYRAVVCGTAGRLALPCAWGGARAARVPLLLWTALWAHPRSPAHALSFVALRRLYRSADAVVTYGPHVSAYVRARGARNVHIAPQAVDNAFWGAAAGSQPATWRGPDGPGTVFLFIGRPERGKGLSVLLAAWRASGLAAADAALVVVGVETPPLSVPADSGVTYAGVVGPGELRNFYASADVLVLPSMRTSSFLEPWGLVANEAMNQRLPVIATDAVGAAAGGLVRDGRNGLVVPAGDASALAGAMRRLAFDEPLRARLGETGARDVRAFTYEAWAAGFAAALRSLGLSRTDPPEAHATTESIILG
jgi:glycosyltransferase involved in cell wall biosynthesis